MSNDLDIQEGASRDYVGFICGKATDPMGLDRQPGTEGWICAAEKRLINDV
jgi:hypothetical protein